MKRSISGAGPGAWPPHESTLTKALMLLVMVLLWDASPAPVLAALVAGPRIPIATGLNPEYVASEMTTPVAYDPENQRFLTAWIEEQPDEQSTSYIRTSLLLRLINLDGALAGSPVALRPFNNHQIQANPHVVFDPQARRYFAVWLEWGYQDDEVGTYGQFISSEGSPLGLPFLITPHGEKFTPVALLFNPADQRFLLLLLSGQPPGQANNLSGQFITAEGALYGSRFQITNYTTGYGVTQTVAAFDPQIQKYLLVYQAADFDQIRGRFLQADGTPEGDEWAISSQLRFPDSVINDPLHHRFLVLWRATHDDPDALLLNAEGSALASFRLCRPCPTGTYGRTYKGGFDTILQEYLVVWYDDKIYGQLVTADGQKAGAYSPLYASSTGGTSPVAGFALAPRMAGALVTWSELVSEEEGNNFYGLIAKPGGFPGSLLQLLLLTD